MFQFDDFRARQKALEKVHFFKGYLVSNSEVRLLFVRQRAACMSAQRRWGEPRLTIFPAKSIFPDW